MADSTIQGLIPIDELEKDDLFPIWDNSAGNDNTKKATALQMAKFVGSAGLSSVNITSNTKDFVISIEGKELQDAMTLNITALVEITGSENDVLTIAYNGGEAKNIKVNKDGVLADYVPFNVDSSWKFLQAFTSLDVKYIENLDCWIVVGNPVVFSNSSSTSGYTIYADGRKVYRVALQWRSNTRVRCITPIALVLNLDGGNDNGNFALVTDGSCAIGNTDFSLYDSRYFTGYRLLHYTLDIDSKLIGGQVKLDRFNTTSDYVFINFTL
ncbi:MAG: hypothetical protein MJ179_02650 [Treponema sp.]|nr:hypothetical protein [Treponema sp.]